jgi:hypothetical protein
MARTTTTEGQSQAAILDYLAARRVFAIRINNTPTYDTARGIFRKMPKHTPKGVADKTGTQSMTSSM